MAGKCTDVHDCVVCTELGGTVNQQCGKIKILTWIVGFFVVGAITSSTIAAVAKSESNNTKKEAVRIEKRVDNLVTKDLFNEYRSNQDKQHQVIMKALDYIQKEI